MKILLTGGLGFIGSHTAVELIEGGHEPVIVDNLSNSKIEVLDKIEKITGKRPKFYEIDVCDKKALENVFESREKSPLPNSNVRKRDVAPDIEALINPIIATIPPTTPYIP